MVPFEDWIEQTAALSASEKGRLMDALAKYGRGDGDWADAIRGNERCVFPVLRARLDGRAGGGGLEGVAARAWLRHFGAPVGPATARVVARWAAFLGLDSEVIIERAVADAAAGGGDDPVGDVIAALREWKARGIGDAADPER